MRRYQAKRNTYDLLSFIYSPFNRSIKFNTKKIYCIHILFNQMALIGRVTSHSEIFGFRDKSMLN